MHPFASSSSVMALVFIQPITRARNQHTHPPWLAIFIHKIPYPLLCPAYTIDETCECNDQQAAQKVYWVNSICTATEQ